MRILPMTFLVSATTLSTIAFAQNLPVKPHATPTSLESPAARELNDYRAQDGAYRLRMRLDHRPVGGEEFWPGDANGS